MRLAFLKEASILVSCFVAQVRDSNAVGQCRRELYCAHPARQSSFGVGKMLWMTDFSPNFKCTPPSGVAAVSSQKVASVMNSRD